MGEPCASIGVDGRYFALALTNRLLKFYEFKDNFFHPGKACKKCLSKSCQVRTNFEPIDSLVTTGQWVAIDLLSFYCTEELSFKAIFASVDVL